MSYLFGFIHSDLSIFKPVYNMVILGLVDIWLTK